MFEHFSSEIVLSRDGDWGVGGWVAVGGFEVFSHFGTCYRGIKIMALYMIQGHNYPPVYTTGA